MRLLLQQLGRLVLCAPSTAANVASSNWLLVLLLLLGGGLKDLSQGLLQRLHVECRQGRRRHACKCIRPGGKPA